MKIKHRKWEEIKYEKLKDVKNLEKEQKEIKNIFYDDGTKQRHFINNVEHSELCSKNTELILLPLRTLTETVNKLNSTVEEMTRSLSNAEKTIAVIQSITKKGGSRYYDPPESMNS